MFKKIDPKLDASKLEEGVLKFWEKNDTFKKSVEKDAPNGDYVFYDGPPFITGLPHYATLLPSIAKDVVPRYQTMRGYRVERVWGWDCHGLPAENKVEEQLGLRNKKDIEVLGVDKFVGACRSYVSDCSDQWKWYIDRIGRWVDMDHSYRTMDLNYMESVIWAFKELYNKGLIYEGYRTSLHCPRCATPLSKFEITMDAGCYRDVTDTSVVVKFRISKPVKENGMYFLAWTTTPWTLSGNLALAISKKIKYIKVKVGDETYILAKDRAQEILGNIKYKVTEEIRGKDLVGYEYEPIFDLGNSEIEKNKNIYKVYSADFVTTEDGTGIVHIAPNFGEDDFEFGKTNNLPLVDLMDENGVYTKNAGSWVGEYFKKANSRALEELEKRKILFSKIEYTHPYPFCYRCDTPLIYRTQESWYLKISELKKKMLASNKNIKWVPEYFKEGRFKYNIENAPDWSLSRSRYWGSPVPAWRCDKCKELKVVGSLDEIKKLSGEEVKDLHRPEIDLIEFKCNKCKGVMRRVPEVMDCWFESGAMPFAQFHYPFENKDIWDKKFPADFIVEYTGQLRGWFYYLHVLGNALFDSVTFKNVVVTGVLSGTDGRKMSKSYGNYPDPKKVLTNYGADVLRFYFMNSQIMTGGDMDMSEGELGQIKKGMYRMLWNSYSFFVTYASLDNWDPDERGDFSESKRPLMDRWLISRRNTLVKNVTDAMESYELPTACRHLSEFMDELSNWYIRRSRKRFWKSEDDLDKKAAYHTLYKTLMVYASLLAPFMPFVTEEIYQNMKAWRKGKKESIHLTDWPKADEKAIDKKIERDMEIARQIVEAGLSQRNEKGIKVRQPLTSLTVTAPVASLPKDLVNIISEEVNVKTLMLKNVPRNIRDKGAGVSVKLDTKITPELKAEGIARDFVRFIQDGRKKAGFNVEDRIRTSWNVIDVRDVGIVKALQSQAKYIAKETLSVEFIPRAESRGEGTSRSLDKARDKQARSEEYTETVKLDGKEVRFGILRIR